MTSPRTPEDNSLLRSEGRRCILLLGNAAAAEMQPVRDAVFATFSDAEIRCIRSHHQLADDWTPDLIVACQSHPDEFTPSNVHAMIRRFPLARFVCAAGLWCESDGRNRDAWPIGVRVPARIVEQRVRIEYAILQGERPPLPLTAGREEAFEYDVCNSREIVPLLRPGTSDSQSMRSTARPAEAVPAANSGPELGRASSGTRTAAVISPDRDLRQRFEADLTAGGLRLVTIEESSSPDVVLWDADPVSDERLEALRRLRQEFSSATIIGLMNFARPEDVQKLRRAGADAVCGKLVSGAGLMRQITACIGR